VRYQLQASGVAGLRRFPEMEVSIMTAVIPAKAGSHRSARCRTESGLGSRLWHSWTVCEGNAWNSAWLMSLPPRIVVPQYARQAVTVSPMRGILPHDGCRSRPRPTGWTTSSRWQARSRPRPRARGGARWVPPSQNEDPRREVAELSHARLCVVTLPACPLGKNIPDKTVCCATGPSNALSGNRVSAIPALATRGLLEQPGDRPP
jgi:hypothetical protein